MADQSQEQPSDNGGPPENEGSASESSAKEKSQQTDDKADGNQDDSDGDESADLQPSDSRGKLETNTEIPRDDKRDPVAAVEFADDGKLMSQQEAMKMLQSIRDRDMVRRYRLERAERSRYVPVERDW